MNIVCEICGDIGYKQLLICCRDCKGSPTHQYCLDKVIFDGSLAAWSCYECQQRSGEVNCSGSLEKVSSERSSHAHSGSTLPQPNTKIVESERDAGPGSDGNTKSGMTKYGSISKNYFPSTNSRQKHKRKKPNVQPTGNFSYGKGRNTVAKGLRSCEMIGTETTKNDNGENQQVDNENSVHSLNSKQPTPLIVNCLGYTLGDKAIKGLRRNSKRTPKSLNAKFKGLVKTKNGLGSKNKTYIPVPVHESPVLEKSGANLSSRHTDQDNQVNQPASVGCKNTEVKSGKDSKKVVSTLQDKCLTAASLRDNKSEGHDDSDSSAMDGLMPEKEKELRQRSMGATVAQQSTLQDDAMDEVMACSPNMHILAKENIENQNMPSEHIENQNRKENQCEPSNLPSEHIGNQSRKENQSEPLNLFDQAHSSSSLEIYPAKFLPEDSTGEVETSVEFGNPRKRRQLILLDYDDDDDEEKAGYVHPDPQCQKCDTPTKNSKIEKTVQTGDLSNSNPSDGGPVKKRRRYIDANEDEDDEAVIDVANAISAQNDVTNCALDDGANLESQTAVAENHPLQSRIASDSDTSDQQYYIYSRPRDEPVWSGAFKINGEVFGKLDAYLSNKACQKVWDLSRMLQPVVEVMKLPRLQAWPKRWTSAAPTDDRIGLFFFPRSSRPNEESNKLVNKIIESDDALKVTIGVVELLIFPSTLLPEQNQLFQGKHYLWGVFKRIKNKSDRGVLVGEQDGLVCATEECNLQEQHFLYQQDDIRCVSSGQETSAVKPVMHVENETVVEHKCLEQKVAMKIAQRKGIRLPDSKLPSAKPNSPEDESKCSVHPRIDREFHVPEEMNQHEERTSSPVLNASSVARSTTECGHGESHFGSGPPTTKLFGLVSAQTPRARQLIEEMISEGALVFSVPGQIETIESCTGSNVGVGSSLNPDSNYQHRHEHPQSFDFISTGLGVPDEASETCLELFPVWQENIGWAPRVEATKEVDLDLSLGARSRAPSA